MKCARCGSWTEVLETRKTDRGRTLRRTRVCGNNCPRFVTYEVYEPVYRNDKQRVRQAAIAAEARAVRFARDREILRDLAAGLKNVEVAAKHGVTRSLVAFIKKKAKESQRGGEEVHVGVSSFGNTKPAAPPLPG